MSVGAFDFDLFLKFKRARTKKERMLLLNELIVQNDPLTKVLTAQLCGRGENRPGRRQKFKREAYVENLSIEEQEAAGRIGMMKALMRFSPKVRDEIRIGHGLTAAKDPAQGLPAFAVWRIKFELQQAIERSGALTLRRGVTPGQRPTMARLDDPEHVETAMEESGAFVGKSEETLAERWAREQAEDEARDVPKTAKGKPATTPGALKMPTSAIAHFIETRCRMVAGAPPMLWEWVAGKYEQHAHALQQVPVPVKLGQEMRERGWPFGRMWHPVFGGTARSVCRLRVMPFHREL